jgi:uncharacterized protein (TIGR02246 family)
MSLSDCDARSTPGSVNDRSVQAALEDFDRAFAAGDADGLTELFAADAQLLLLYGEPLVGRDAILAQWTRLFGRFDTSAWQTDRLIVDVHGDAAYAVSTYTEVLVPRKGTARPKRVVGRLVRFLRREPGGAWRVTLAMNSHVRPLEEV